MNISARLSTILVRKPTVLRRAGRSCYCPRTGFLPEGR